jgi:hypothetical protein
MIGEMSGGWGSGNKPLCSKVEYLHITMRERKSGRSQRYCMQNVAFPRTFYGISCKLQSAERRTTAGKRIRHQPMWLRILVRPREDIVHLTDAQRQNASPTPKHQSDINISPPPPISSLFLCLIEKPTRPLLPPLVIPTLQCPNNRQHSARFDATSEGFRNP